VSLIKKIGLALLLVFLAIQLIQPAHNKSEQLLPTDFEKNFAVPDNEKMFCKTPDTIVTVTIQNTHGMPTFNQWHGLWQGI
jgi:hypothetical protein